MHASGKAEPSARAESVYLAWLEEEDEGARASLDELCQRHPDEALELRRLHEQRERLEAVRARGIGALGARLASRHGRVDPGVALEREEPADDAARALVERLGGRGALAARYRVKGEIERGGQGAVLRVWDDDLRRHLAMKVLVDDERAPSSAAARRRLARFLEEAQVTSQLDHPGIVPVHELGLDAEGRLYFTMKLVRGRDLAAVFELARARREGWSELKALEVLLRVCEAMSYAHDKGVVHRDLKPENVMVGDYGEAYVMDWGLAKLLSRDEPGAPAHDPADPPSGVLPGPAPDSPRYTLGGDVLGTPAYMAPEQARGDQAAVGPRSDVYALGAMLYHLLTGHPPYLDGLDGRDPAGRDGNAVLAALRAGPPRPLADLVPDVAPELEAVCDKAMARDPAQRYGSMSELATDIRAWIEGRAVRAYRTGAWVELVKWTRRNRLAAGAIGAAVLALAAGFALALMLGKQSAQQARMERGQRVQGYVDGARIADTRGRWPEVLELLAKARQAGWESRVEADLLEARALVALSRVDRARDLLVELLDLPDLRAADRARALLMLSDILYSESTDPERPLAMVEEALALGLPPADEHHARCLLSETVPEALEHGLAALEIDPYHLGAHRLVLTILFLTGSTEQAFERARIGRILYPEDPLPSLVEAVQHEMEGRSDEARRISEATRHLYDERGLANVDLLLAMARELRQAYDVEAFLGSSSEESLAAQQRIQALVREWTGSSPAAKLRIPILPCLMKPWGETWQGVSTMMGLDDVKNALDSLFGKKKSQPKQNRMARARPFFTRARAASPEGLFAYYEAACVMNDPDRAANDMEKMREAEALYRAAYESPSFIPGTIRAARLWGTLSQAVLASSGDEAMRSRAIEGFWYFTRLPDLHPGEAGFLSRYALDLGEPELALALGTRLRNGPPGDPTTWLLRARTYQLSGRPEQARAALAELLALDPENAEALAMLAELDGAEGR